MMFPTEGCGSGMERPRKASDPSMIATEATPMSPYDNPAGAMFGRSSLTRIRGRLRPHGARRGHEVAVHVSEGGGAEHDEELGDRGDGEDERELQDGRGLPEGDDHEDGEQRGEGDDDEGDRIGDGVDDLAVVGGEHSRRSADDEPDADRGEADDEGRLRPVDDSRENVSRPRSSVPRQMA